MAKPKASDPYRSAAAYVRRGWPVIPLIAHAKRPLIPWSEFQSRSPDNTELQRWFMRWPNANVGIVTGQTAGLIVLDIDPKHGGAESLTELETRNGALPRSHGS